MKLYEYLECLSVNQREVILREAKKLVSDGKYINDYYVVLFYSDTNDGCDNDIRGLCKADANMKSAFKLSELSNIDLTKFNKVLDKKKSFTKEYAQAHISACRALLNKQPVSKVKQQLKQDLIEIGMYRKNAFC